MRTGGQRLGGHRRVALALYALGTLLALLILGSGHLLLKGHSREDRQRAQGELGTIADLKAAQISEWYQERMVETDRLAHSLLDQHQLRRYLQAPDPVLEGRVKLWLELQQASYSKVVLIDASGRTLLTVPPEPGPPPGVFDPSKRELALATGERVVSDLHQDPGSPGTHLSIWVPINAEGGAMPWAPCCSSWTPAGSSSRCSVPGRCPASPPRSS